MRTVLAFASAVATAAVLGSVVQTQFNLAAIQALGVAVPIGPRAGATVHDLVTFAPAYAVLAGALLLPAFALARVACARWQVQRSVLFPVAAAAALLATFVLMNGVPAVPSMIAATRSAAGAITMAASAAVGGWVYAVLSGRSR